MKIHHNVRFALAVSALLLLLVAVTPAQQGYKKPPKEVLDILNAPPTPGSVISPNREYMLLITGTRYPPLADLAQPMLRLGGLRINPQSNAPHRAPYALAMSLMRISDGSESKLDLPPGSKIGLPQWSADGKRFAFLNTTPAGVELWVGDTATGKIHKLK